MSNKGIFNDDKLRFFEPEFFENFREFCLIYWCSDVIISFFIKNPEYRAD